MKVYFAHSMKDYNTERESKGIEEIIKIFGDEVEIINPKDIECPTISTKMPLSMFYNILDRQLAQYFFPEICKCKNLVFMREENGKLSYAVKKEKCFADCHDCDVLEIKV